MPRRKLIIPITSPPLEQCAVPIRPSPFPINSPEATKLKSVREHFDDDRLQIAENEGKAPTRSLEDVERMFLVSFELELEALMEAHNL